MLRDARLLALLLCACSSGAGGEASDGGAAADGAPPAIERRCGPGPGAYSAVYTRADIEKLAGCTVYVGRLQEDSVRELSDFTGLEALRSIEGTLNVFRSPGFLTLQGLENLETIEGDLFIHLNPNLRTVSALGRLRLITGSLYISSNEALPLAEASALAERVTVMGTKTIR